MITKRLISALLDQVVVLSIAIEAVSNEAKQCNQGYEIEYLLHQVALNMSQAGNDLSELERILLAEEITTEITTEETKQ